MQALKRLWTEELHTHFTQLLARPPEPLAQTSIPPLSLRPSLDEQPAEALASDATPNEAVSALEGPQDENVVRPAAFKRESDAPVAPTRERPELSAAVGAIAQATDLIKAAELKANRKAQQAVDIAFRTMSQLEHTEAQLQNAQHAIRELTSIAQAATVRATEQIAAAEAGTVAERERAQKLEAEIETYKARLLASEEAIRQADQRVFAAETRALEAIEDLQYLEGLIRDEFSLQAA